jgi:hypothetical protein
VAELLFVAGVPATGKTWLGNWLAETRGYTHIDAERNWDPGLVATGFKAEWDSIFQHRDAQIFAEMLRRLSRPAVVNWGFPTQFLHLAAALKLAGFQLVWLTGDRDQARAAFVRRGGIDPRCFDRQMDAIERDWPHIARVFEGCIVQGLNPDGSQRHPEEIWHDITRTVR